MFESQANQSRLERKATSQPQNRSTSFAGPVAALLCLSMVCQPRCTDVVPARGRRGLFTIPTERGPGKGPWSLLVNAGDNLTRMGRLARNALVELLFISGICAARQGDGSEVVAAGSIGQRGKLKQGQRSVCGVGWLTRKGYLNNRERV